TWQTPQTANFTAVANRAYPVNTTSSAITVNLPQNPSSGDQIAFVDYAGTFATNYLTIAAGTTNINGVVKDIIFTISNSSAQLVYIDSTQGWKGYVYNNTVIPQELTVEYLAIAGGGGGGGFGGGGGAGGRLTSSSYKLIYGKTYNLTIGAGGTGGTGGASTSGTNTSLISSGLASINAIGGGSGLSYNYSTTYGASVGGSGGGGSPGASGTAGQGNSGGNWSGAPYYSHGGGGGAGAAGSNGGASGGGAGGSGASSSITGSAVIYAGGGGGGGYCNYPAGGAGGSGGGGAGGNQSAASGSAGTTNTGGGGGGGGEGCGSVRRNGGNGGSGILIIAYLNIYPDITTIGSGLTYALSTTSRPGYKVYSFTAGTGTITI
ncbi:MAG: hypothetical protein EB073_07765, partial [Burkholderiaceae bacterium]|nr:hypothetical protein [Burkholderiaceae bacterium]